MVRRSSSRKKALLTGEAGTTLDLGGLGFACLGLMLIGGIFIALGLALATLCSVAVVVLHWDELRSALREQRFTRHAVLPAIVVIALPSIGALIVNKDAILAWGQPAPKGAHAYLANPDCVKQAPQATHDAFAAQEIAERVALFQREIAAYAPELGPARSCTIVEARSSRSEFQYSDELWTVEPKQIFLLKDDHWERHGELRECIDPRACQIGNEPQRIAYFESLKGVPPMPAGLHAPFGATGVFLALHPERFKDVGWQVWHCETKPDEPILYQEFEKAFVIGFYRASRANRDGEMIILNKEDHTILPPPDLAAYKIFGSACLPEHY